MILAISITFYVVGLFLWTWRCDRIATLRAELIGLVTALTFADSKSVIVDGHPPVNRNLAWRLVEFDKMSFPRMALHPKYWFKPIKAETYWKDTAFIKPVVTPMALPMPVGVMGKTSELAH